MGSVQKLLDTCRKLTGVMNEIGTCQSAGAGRKWQFMPELSALSRDRYARQLITVLFKPKTANPYNKRGIIAAMIDERIMACTLKKDSISIKTGK